MTPRQFDRWAAETRLKPGSKARQGARLCLVKGLSEREAARRVGCSSTTVQNGKWAVLRALKSGGGYPSDWILVTRFAPPAVADSMHMLADEAEQQAGLK